MTGRSGNVRSVPPVLCTSINQDQAALLDPSCVGLVMQDSPIGPGPDDAGVTQMNAAGESSTVPEDSL